MFLNINSKTLPTILIIAVIFTGVLGFIFIDYVNHSGQYGCPFSLVTGSDCPPIGNSILLVNHYISSFQYVSQGVTNIDQIFSLMFILFVGLLILDFSNLKKKQGNYVLNHIRKRINTLLNFMSEYQFTHWLNLQKTLSSHTQKWVYVDLSY